MKILVTNVHSAENAGDRVLLEVTLEELRATFPGSEITVAINDARGAEACPGARYAGSFTGWFKAAGDKGGGWRRSRLLWLPVWAVQSWLVALTGRYLGRPWPLPKDPARRELLLAYRESDFVVSCPGNFFFSTSGLGIPFLLSVYALAHGWLAGKPLYMMPQTIGPLTRRRERWSLGWVLRRMRFVSVRDETSLATVASLGIPRERCRVLPDIAFLFRGAGDLRPFEALARGEDLPRPYVGATVIDWGALNRRFARQAGYEQAVAAAVSEFLARHGGTVFLFPQVTGPSQAEDDRRPAARVAQLVTAASERVVLVDAVWSPGQLRAAYGQMDAFIGTRLHSNIFALTAGTVAVAIAYQYKTHGIFKMLGLSEWVIDIEEVDAGLLSARLEALWQRRAEVRAEIDARLPALQEEARAAVAAIAADFGQLGAGPSARGR
ncbi:MAG: polysaccharide pyruvyl transferase family protein [Anaerolineae bacterium]|nr:polysaccharide pyruvyl transferase family protein [Anaerolineae bacterium]